MKQRKAVSKRGKKQAKITRLMASAETAGPRRGARVPRGAPPSREWIIRYGQYYKPRKLAVTLRLDADVLAWFKKKGRGYQTRINDALRAMMMEQLGSTGD